MEPTMIISNEEYKELIKKSIALDAIFQEKEAYDMGRIAAVMKPLFISVLPAASVSPAADEEDF